MSTTAVRAMQWIGFVGDLLRQLLTRMPHQAVVDQLRQTFDVTAASYNWAEADGSQGIFIRPCDTLAPLAEEFLAWQRGELDLSRSRRRCAQRRACRPGTGRHGA